MENNKKKNNIAVLVICVLVFVGCILTNAVISRSQGSNSYAGLLGQIQVVASLLMVLFAHKLGFIVGCVLNGSNALFVLVMQVIIAGRPSALPGVAVSSISIVILAIIYHYVSKNEKILSELSDSYEKQVEQTKLLREKEESLNFLAYYDTLTSMPNRASFMDELNGHLNKAKATSVLYVDLDNFRLINDRFGHSTGDELLKIYAEKIKSVCGTDIFAAKIGGDEFGLIFGEEFDQKRIMNFIQDISNALAESVSLHGDVFSITASYGVANFPKDSRSAEILFRCAETAMFTAKANGKNQLFFYVGR